MMMAGVGVTGPMMATVRHARCQSRRMPLWVQGVHVVVHQQVLTLFLSLQQIETFVKTYSLIFTSPSLATRAPPADCHLLSA